MLPLTSLLMLRRFLDSEPMLFSTALSDLLMPVGFGDLFFDDDLCFICIAYSIL